MSITVATMTLAQACNLLDCGGSLDSDNYIDFTNGTLSFTGSTGRNQDLSDLLFESTRKVCQEAKVFYGDLAMTAVTDKNKIYLSGAAQFTADLSATRTFAVALTQPTKVWVNGYQLTDGKGRPGLWSLEHFNRYWYSWRTVSSSKPQACTVDYGANCLIFNTPFSSTVVSAAGNRACGFGHPDRFDYATDSAKTWAVHPDLHRAVVYRAIVDSKMYYATEFDELGVMERLRNESDEDIARFRDKMTDQLSALQDSWGQDRSYERIVF